MFTITAPEPGAQSSPREAEQWARTHGSHWSFPCPVTRTRPPNTGWGGPRRTWLRHRSAGTPRKLGVLAYRLRYGLRDRYTVLSPPWPDRTSRTQRVDVAMAPLTSTNTSRRSESHPPPPPLSFDWVGSLGSRGRNVPRGNPQWLLRFGRRGSHPETWGPSCRRVETLRRGRPHRLGPWSPHTRDKVGCRFTLRAGRGKARTQGVI